MVELKAGSPAFSGMAIVTLLTLLAFCCCHSRKGSGNDDAPFLVGKYDGSSSGGRDSFYRQHQRHQQHQRLQGSLPDKSRFLATAVNLTVSGEEDEVGEEGFEESDARNKESHEEGRMGFIDREKMQDRCFVLEAEEQTRCHANIFFFGVSKCGTTSMVKWMTRHPQLRWVSRVKSSGEQIKPGQEARALQFKTQEEYASKYPLTAPEATEADPVVDYTPHYSILADVPYLIKGLYGKAASDGTVKYIVCLREPAARTISSWRFKYDLEGIQQGKKKDFFSERRSLEESFEEGSRRVDALVECRSRYLASQDYDEIDLEKCKPGEFLEENPYFSHVGKSMYFLQLDRWTRLFGHSNVKVLFLEEVAADPYGELAGVFDFLGMDLLDDVEWEKGLPSRKKWDKIVGRLHNTADVRKEEVLGPQVTPELVQSMREFFAPHNAQLAELLGRSLPDGWSLPNTSR